MAGTVKALWVASFHAEFGADRTPLVPHETVADVPEGEARDSDNWQIVTKPKTAKDTD